MRMYEDYDQNQETFNDNQMGDSIEDNMARSEMEVQSEQYEEPEMEI